MPSRRKVVIDLSIDVEDERKKGGTAGEDIVLGKKSLPTSSALNESVSEEGDPERPKSGLSRSSEKETGECGDANAGIIASSLVETALDDKTDTSNSRTEAKRGEKAASPGGKDMLPQEKVTSTANVTPSPRKRISRAKTKGEEEVEVLGTMAGDKDKRKRSQQQFTLSAFSGFSVRPSKKRQGLPSPTASPNKLKTTDNVENSTLKTKTHQQEQKEGTDHHEFTAKSPSDRKGESTDTLSLCPETHGKSVMEPSETEESVVEPSETEGTPAASTTTEVIDITKDDENCALSKETTKITVQNTGSPCSPSKCIGMKTDDKSEETPTSCTTGKGPGEISEGATALVAENGETPVQLPTATNTPDSDRKGENLEGQPTSDVTEKPVSKSVAGAPPDSGKTASQLSETTKTLESADKSGVLSKDCSKIKIVDEKKELSKEKLAGGESALRQRMVHRYRQRQFDLLHRINVDIEKEFPPLQLKASDLPSRNDKSCISDPETFPDELIPMLAAFVQGSSLPLSELAAHSRQGLSKLRKEAACLNKINKSCDPETEMSGLSLPCVTEKIKLIAQRKALFGIHTLTPKPTDVPAPKIDKLEDTTAHFVWRWEITSLSLLPAESLSIVKRGRTARRKVTSHYKAILKLLDLIHRSTREDDNGHDQTKETKQVPCLDDQIRVAEEKVLKFERDEESRRLLEQERERKRAHQAKMKEEEKNLQRQKKEEEKRKKDEERAVRRAQKEEQKKLARLEKENKELRQASEKVEKQKAFMAQFFVSSGPKKTVSDSSGISGSNQSNYASLSCSEQGKQGKQHSLNSSDFWERINCMSSDNLYLHDHIERTNRKCVTRMKTKQVKVSVVVSAVQPPGSYGFGEDPCYSERRTLSIPNKYKFLGFHEDHRPFYRGTWSKQKSNLITGRRPFAKDSTFLDYEVDSEAEWEENDCDDGESVCSGGDGDEDDLLLQDEEPGIDTRKYNYSDGWLQDDDESIDASGDEDESDSCDKEDRKQWKKQLKVAKRDEEQQQSNFAPWIIVAPRPGGLSLSDPDSSKIDLGQYVAGPVPEEGLDLLSKLKVCILSQVTVCLESHPPGTSADLVPEKEDTQQNPSKKQFSVADKKHLCRFVHHCQLSSKDKIVEEFRAANPQMKFSRAMLLRKVDSLAVKRRLKGGGVLWEIKEEILKNLGLKELLTKKCPVSPVASNTKSSTAIEAKKANATEKLEKKEKVKKRKRKHVKPATPKVDSKTPIASYFIKKKDQPIDLTASESAENNNSS